MHLGVSRGRIKIHRGGIIRTGIERPVHLSIHPSVHLPSVNTSPQRVTFVSSNNQSNSYLLCKIWMFVKGPDVKVKIAQFLPAHSSASWSSPSSPYAAAAAESLQSGPTLCDPIDGSPPGSPAPGILQARTLEWIAIAFSVSTANS